MGADANASTPTGSTALMQAAANGRAGSVRALLKGGATVDAVDKKGATALILAAKFSPGAETARLLVEAGADTTRRHGRNGKTALEWAEHTDHDVTAALLQRRSSADTAQ